MSIYLAVFLGFAAFVALLLLAGLVQHVTRKPQPQPEPAPAPVHRCHVRKCGRVAHWLVRRHDTGALKWVCLGCRDEGTAWGWWAA